MTRRERTRIIIVLGSLSALGPFTIDMYLPGFASIARDLHTTVSAVGYSLTSYFIGISFGQLIYGPLTDRYGRKRPLLIGLGIYIVAAIACALSPTVEWLIGARLVMALGACAGIVASRAIVRDLFPVEEIAGVFSTFMLIIAVSPMLAPTAGGYVTATLGWQLIFYILTAIAIAITVAVAAGLGESKRRDDRVSLRPFDLVKRYVGVLTNRQFLVFSVTAGFSFGGLLTYVSGAPYLLMQLLGLSQTQFGWGFAINALGLIAGSQVNRRLLRHYSARQITRAAVTAQVIIGSMLAAGAFFNYIPLAGVFTLMGSFLFFTGLVNPNTAALSIAPFEEAAGSAAALLGCLQMGFATLVSAMVSVLANGTAFPMMMIIWGTSLSSFILLRTLGRREYASLSEPALR